MCGKLAGEGIMDLEEDLDFWQLHEYSVPDLVDIDGYCRLPNPRESLGQETVNSVKVIPTIPPSILNKAS